MPSELNWYTVKYYPAGRDKPVSREVKATSVKDAENKVTNNIAGAVVISAQYRGPAK